MTNEEIIALLRKDMQGEHQAIIQYVRHAYALGEGGPACEIEGIARDEMRHFDWLADAIGELGGDPTLERDPVDMAGAPPAEQMRKDVVLEQIAIDQYREHIELIEDPTIRRLLARIVHDELRHQGMFAGLAEELTTEAPQEGGAGEVAPAKQIPERLGEILNTGIRHEYTVILQYLYHSFVAQGKELSEELQNAAINEMQHMGWLSEALAKRGGDPDTSHTDMVLTHDPEENLKADIAIEQEVTGDYSSHLSEIQDPSLKELIQTIRDHEIYHDALFKDLLAEVEDEEEQPAESPAESDEPRKPGPIPSVGSLISK
jgi:bacterioferritin